MSQLHLVQLIVVLFAQPAAFACVCVFLCASFLRLVVPGA
jgi:hypothetical protein